MYSSNAGFPTQQPNVFQQSANNLTQAGNITSGIAGQAAPMVNPANYNARTINSAGYNSDGYNAKTINGANPIMANQVQAGQFGGMDLSGYMNPYTSQVIDTSMADMNRARQMAQSDNGAAASAAGAFGGSRHGLVEAETNRGFADQAGQLSAGLRQAGYQNAQQAAFQDIGNTMQADLANQGANLQADTTTAANTLQKQGMNQNAMNTQRQFNTAARNDSRQYNAANSQQARLANQSAMNTQRQFNTDNRQQARLANQDAQFQSRGVDLAAASQLGSLSNLGFGMGSQINNTMSQQGAQQQAAMQALIDAAKGQFSGFTGQQSQGLAQLMAAVTGSPAPVSQTESSKPGLLNIGASILGLGD